MTSQKKKQTLPPTAFAIKLGNRIDICLRGNNMTHLVASGNFGCSTKHIGRMIKGTTDPGVNELRIMARALGIPWMILMED